MPKDTRDEDMALNPFNESMFFVFHDFCPRPLVGLV